MPIWIRRVIWDDANIGHVARHGVSQDEAEDVCYGDALPLRTRRGRYLLIGRTDAGRLLSVFITPRGRQAYYVITARDANEVERRLARRKGRI